MPNYAVHDAEGNILRTLTLHQDDLPLQTLADGEFITEVDARPQDRIDLETGSVIQQAYPEIAEGEDWVIQRRALFGPMPIQLNMLYDGMAEHGVPHPAFQAWFDHVTRVKNAVPKEALDGPVLLATLEPLASTEGSE